MCDKVKKMPPVQTAYLAFIGLRAWPLPPVFQVLTPPRALPSHPASMRHPSAGTGQPTLFPVPGWAVAEGSAMLPGPLRTISPVHGQERQM